MSQFYIVSESSEDIFDATNDLQDAIRIAREVTRQGQSGDAVSVTHDGMTVRQFVLMPDGQVAEEKVA
jgi:hypothetical protein